MTTDLVPHVFKLFAGLEAEPGNEANEVLLRADGIRLERIVSNRAISPPGFWYDQEEAEWVMVLRGSARIVIAGEFEDRLLKPGDAIYLPARCRHRIAWTSPEEPTVWLALFVAAAAKPAL